MLAKIVRPGEVEPDESPPGLSRRLGFEADNNPMVEASVSSGRANLRYSSKIITHIESSNIVHSSLNGLLELMQNSKNRFSSGSFSCRRYSLTGIMSGEYGGN